MIHPNPLLTRDRVELILVSLPRLRIGVLGDLFLDRYLDLDASLTEPSLETGLEAYQVVGVRSYPGAAGTVVNNLAALGVGQIVPIAVIGDDGEGHELWQSLEALPAVQLHHVQRGRGAGFRTPTYCKPMLHQAGLTARELHRFDIKNRKPLREMDAMILPALESAWEGLDALLVVDQVSEAECGVVTTGARKLLFSLAQRTPARFVLADSRERIGEFRGVAVKPNDAECRRAVGEQGSEEERALQLARRCGRPVFCTLGARGMLVADPPSVQRVPAYPIEGPIDSVGAGDSSSAAIACAVAAGASLTEAAAFGNLVASITIQQIGVTGTASPEQVWRRWEEVET
jgi:bifunctional ADP-heptose synthase (sugar kinase/adenylyltransferase)